MGAGASIIVFALGAILRFAVSVTTTGFNIHAIGIILMIVGAVSFLVSIAFWGSWGGFGGTARRRRTVVEGPSGVTTSTTEERVS